MRNWKNFFFVHFEQFSRRIRVTRDILSLFRLQKQWQQREINKRKHNNDLYISIRFNVVAFYLYVSQSVSLHIFLLRGAVSSFLFFLFHILNGWIRLCVAVLQYYLCLFYINKFTETDIQQSESKRWMDEHKECKNRKKKIKKNKNAKLLKFMDLRSVVLHWYANKIYNI